MLGTITNKSFTINYYLYKGENQDSEWLSTVLVQNNSGQPMHTTERAKLYAKQYNSLDGLVLWDIEPAMEENGVDVITINSGSGVIKKIANEREARQTFGSK
jgi:hypothetical protein|tara:strand:- start:1511 stop:1816 length:306 start_codon:yes stop_codon:yes gene_type:complete